MTFNEMGNIIGECGEIKRAYQPSEAFWIADIDTKSLIGYVNPKKGLN